MEIQQKLSDQQKILDLQDEILQKQLKKKIEISWENVQFIFNPSGNVQQQDLIIGIDSGALARCKLTLMLFIMRTCQYQFSVVEKLSLEEGEYILNTIKNYLEDKDFAVEHEILTKRCYLVILSPIKIFENSGFVQVWSDIMFFLQQYIICKEQNFQPYSFPNYICTDLFV